MEYFAGLDVSVKETSVCIVDDAGKIVREVKVVSEPEALLSVLTNPGYHFKRIGLEAGPLSQWLFSALAEAGLPVICVETRHMRAVLKAQINKTDRNDARGMAQMMRAGLYRPVHVKTLRSQKLRMLLTHRKLLQSKEHGAGAEEQQALEDRMVEYVEQSSGERKRGGERHAVRLERQRQAEPDKNDPDIFYRVIGEQAFEVVLHQRIEHTHHRGDAADSKHHHAPPPVRRSEQVEHDAHEAVDRDLGHHAAHQRGDMARRSRMRERQPSMQRHHARFRAGPASLLPRER